MKIIDVVAEAGYLDTIKSIAEQQEINDLWFGPRGEDGRMSVRLLVSPEKTQTVLDAFQHLLGSDPNARIIVIPTEVALPRPESPDKTQEEMKRSVSATREELYNTIEQSAKIDYNFFLLVFLSTIVAAIGLTEDNVAVVIGAMVIAPLLGPNIALALATALGDTPLMWQGLKGNIIGLGIAILVSVSISWFWPVNMDSTELISRTDVGLDSIALALASGAAAVLSFTTGLPNVLVGVMVAVALLPPAATLGLMAGSGQWVPATGAGLLLAVNIVCVNLSAKLVFLFRGVKPRTWHERKKARQSMAIYILFWITSLLILVVAIFLRQKLFMER